MRYILTLLLLFYVFVVKSQVNEFLLKKFINDPLVENFYSFNNKKFKVKRTYTLEKKDSLILSCIEYKDSSRWQSINYDRGKRDEICLDSILSDQFREIRYDKDTIKVKRGIVFFKGPNIYRVLLSYKYKDEVIDVFYDKKDRIEKIKIVDSKRKITYKFKYTEVVYCNPAFENIHGIKVSSFNTEIIFDQKGNPIKELMFWRHKVIKSKDYIYDEQNILKSILSIDYHPLNSEIFDINSISFIPNRCNPAMKIMESINDNSQHVVVNYDYDPEGLPQKIEMKEITMPSEKNLILFQKIEYEK